MACAARRCRTKVELPPDGEHVNGFKGLRGRALENRS
jgi:hypothetical protein